MGININAKSGLLTIGIPTFNGGDGLPALLGSVEKLNLTTDQYELLVVDNCSTDNTESVIDELKLKFTNIRYYKNDRNLGRVENWNRVLELMHGEYLILMNVNDRFGKAAIIQQLEYLKQNPNIPLVMNDVISGAYQYPNWPQTGIIDFKSYVKKTFLELEYPEFNSLGILQQHIFRTKVIRDHRLRFDLRIPRTTDRVFIANVISKGGGRFTYNNCVLVEWNTTAPRFHSNVHHHFDKRSFDHLWINEYVANTEVSQLADLSLKDTLQSQMVVARFLGIGRVFRLLKRLLFRNEVSGTNIEMQTSPLFYKYLKDQARKLGIPLNYLKINQLALVRAIHWFVKSISKGQLKDRSLHGLIEPLPEKYF